MSTNLYIEDPMAASKEPTAALKANVRVSIRDEFSRFCRDNGEIQADTLGRLIEWFMDLDSTTRILVMGKLKDDDARGVAIMALERMARDVEREGLKAPMKRAAKPAKP